MTEEIGTSRNVQHHHYSCLWPVGRLGGLFCGASLVVIGAVCLSSNLGLISEEWWEIVIPVLLIGWGAAIVFGSRSDEKEMGR